MLLSQIPIHPAMVHFPIALITIALLYELLNFIVRKKEFEIVSKWVLLFGAIGAVFAVISGLLAETSAEHTEAAHQIIEMHKLIGILVTITAIILSAWRIFVKETLFYKYRIIYVVLFILVFIFMGIGASLGGKLVYEYGVGVKKEIFMKAVEVKSEKSTHVHEHKHSH
jgi:uncharacterized membrane protein